MAVTINELVSLLLKTKSSVYHFTDIRNLKSIREHGILSMAELRRQKIEPIPGGNQWSLDADRISGMDKYVHICFFRDHPMAFVAKQEGRIETVRYLRINPKVMLHPDALITDRVSNKRGTEAKSASEMVSKIDWNVLYSRTDWKDPAVQARLKIAKVCELLIPNNVATNMIENLG